MTGVFYFRPKLTMADIQWEKVPEFYHKYIRQVQAPDLETALEVHATSLPALLGALPDEHWSYRYAPGKWSIREVVQHIIDTERIFCYRALCFTRGESASLPGFNENLYANQSRADQRSKESLLEEFDTVQKGTRFLFQSFDPAHLDASGIANGNPIYVKGIGFIIAGHCQHHLNILQERYLQDAGATISNAQ